MKQFSLPHAHGERNLHILQAELQKTAQFSATANLFCQLGDPLRLRIFWLLCHQEECINNIAALLRLTPASVLHQLRALYDCGLISIRQDGREVYYKAADTEGCQLLHQAAEQLMEIGCPENAVDYSGSTEEIIHRVHEYLVTHLADRITIEALSRQFLMNPTTLKRVFKEVYGMSIAAHIKQHRMEQAAKLLTETTDSIYKIALSVGYESQSRFSGAFQETYGVLPSVYRKEAHTADPSGFYCP